MRLIKLAFLSIIILFFVATAISLLIPSHIRISKAINIGADKAAILSLVRDTIQWPNWHPAYMQPDPARRFAHINRKEVQASDTLVQIEMSQGSKEPVLNGWQVHHTAVDSLTLQWYMDFHLKWYPWKKFGSLFYENTYGVMMEQGLGNLKKLSEQ